jgi:hypothetical protein
MNLIVTGSADLETEEWHCIESYGGSLTFHDAQIKCKSSDIAISATDGIVINGSSISAEGGKSGIYSTYNGVTVNGGELKAKGGEYGAFELKVTAGTVTAEGGKVGIAGGGQFLGGSVTAVGTGADSVGIYGEVAFSGAEVVCSGVAAGGRTGLTAFSTAVCFAVALLFAPVFLGIPSAATAPALIVVGMMMMQPVTKIDWLNYREALPAFLTIILMPVAYSISDGILIGVIAYVLMNALTGKAKDISLTMWILAVLFILRYIFI